tara:strand:+ start:189 stop:518 length:330 start_codon:yes stop_codon:yes gene_type:complete
MAYRWHQNPNGHWECINGANGTPAEINRCKGTIGLPPYTPDPERVSIYDPNTIIGRRSLVNGNASRRPLYPSTGDKSAADAMVHSRSKSIGIIPIVIIGAAVYYFFFRK